MAAPISANQVTLTFNSSMIVKIESWAWTGANRVVTVASSMDDTDAITKIFSLMHDPGQLDVTFHGDATLDYDAQLSAAAASMVFTFSDASTYTFSGGMTEVAITGEKDGYVEGSATFAITGAIAHA